MKRVKELFKGNVALQMAAMLFVVCLVTIFGIDAFGIRTAVLSVLPSLHLSAAGYACAVIAPFPITPELTQIAVAYKNPEYIADLVLPRVQVGVQTFKYRKYEKKDGFTIPSTLVGRIGVPNRVEFGFTETEASTIDWGLDEAIPQSDIDNAPVGYDPRKRAAAAIMNLVQLDREKRVADLVFGASNYAASNKDTLSGSSQWSHADSNPFKALLEYLDSCIMRPNMLVFGQSVWTAVRQHANTIKGVLGTASTSGAVTQQQLADALEVSKIVVGKGWYNTANKGQTASLSRIWGDFCAMIYQDAMPDPHGMVTFGMTAQFGTQVGGSKPDANVGLHGGEIVRVGESVKEIITANDLGFLVIDALE